MSLSKSDIILYGVDMPESDDCGFSIYRNTLVQWDRDYDKRVYTLLDEMPANIIDRLLVVRECKASVSFVWCDSVPPEYMEGGDVEVENDAWAIISSKFKPYQCGSI